LKRFGRGRLDAPVIFISLYRFFRKRCKFVDLDHQAAFLGISWSTFIFGNSEKSDSVILFPECGQTRNKALSTLLHRGVGKKNVHRFLCGCAWPTWQYSRK